MGYSGRQPEGHTEGGEKIEKKLKALFVISITIVTLGLLVLVLTPSAYALEYEGDYYLSATTKQNENSTMALAVDDRSVVAYAMFEWVLYLADDTHVTHYDADGVLIVDEILNAGLHIFTYKIDPEEHARAGLTWQIGNDTVEYNLRIASTASQAYDWQTKSDDVTVSAKWITEEQKEIAIGCIVCALIPAIPIIPLIKKRADNEVYPLF